MSFRSSEHEYEPIASPPPPPPPPVVNMVAPVVRITDTDVMPVADSDDSIDDRGRFNLVSALDGDIILPLDGKIEDNAMAGRELGETIDTSDEMESEQLQERLNENLPRTSNPDLKLHTEKESIPDQVKFSICKNIQIILFENFTIPHLYLFCISFSLIIHFLLNFPLCNNCNYSKFSFSQTTTLFLKQVFLIIQMIYRKFDPIFWPNVLKLFKNKKINYVQKPYFM